MAKQALEKTIENVVDVYEELERVGITAGTLANVGPLFSDYKTLRTMIDGAKREALRLIDPFIFNSKNSQN